MSQFARHISGGIKADIESINLSDKLFWCIHYTMETLKRKEIKVSTNYTNKGTNIFVYK